MLGIARRLFAQRGYRQVPAEEIAAAAGVTRGALYHHYADKQALFQAVFEVLEDEIAEEIAGVIAESEDAWLGVVAALGRFLDICQRPEVIQIALTDAPAVLGWQKWRDIEAAHGLGLITRHLQTLSSQGLLVAAPVPVLAQLVLSAVIEAALLIANAQDPGTARDEAGQALLALFAGDGRPPMTRALRPAVLA